MRSAAPHSVPPLPAASVVVCVHQRRLQVLECLASLAASDYPGALEIVVVDDGSRDGSAEAVEEFSARRPELALSLVRNPANLGVSAARNRGIEAATGQVVAFTDSDCTVEPDWLRRLVGRLVAEGADAVSGRVIDDRPRNLAERAYAGTCRIGALGQGRSLVGNNMAFRRAVLREAGGFDPEMSYYCDDDELADRLRAAGRRFAHEPAAVVHHRHRLDLRGYLRMAVRQGQGSARLWARRGSYLGRDMIALAAAALTTPLLALGWPLALVPAAFLLLHLAAVGFAEVRYKGKSLGEALRVLPVQVGYTLVKGGAVAGTMLGRRGLLLATILGSLFLLKIGYDPGLGRNSLDGDFYFQIARHVAEGRGLETNLSLYHQGLQELPHPSNGPPLWPLLLGGLGAAFGLARTALVLPELLYLIALTLLYVLTNRVAVALGTDPVLLPGGRWLDLGHLAVLLFGLNPRFFEFTSLPYTEGLAFSLLFASLLALGDRCGPPARTALAGALAGAAFLTRGQMIGLALGVGLALLARGVRERRCLGHAAIFVAAALATVVPWALFLASWIQPLRPAVMLGVGAYRETPQVPAFQFSVPADSAVGWLLDRLAGVGVAFAPLHPLSYTASFGLAAYLVPLALLWGVWVWARRRPRRLVPPLLPAAVALAGLALVGSVHLVHAQFFLPWLFGFRHGLPFVLLLVVATAGLLVDGVRWRRWTVGILVAASLLQCALRVGHLLERPSFSGLSRQEKELVAWWAAQPTPPTVLTTQAHTLAVYSRAKFHWTHCDQPAETTRQLLRHLPIDYVLVYGGEERCRFVSGVPALTVERTFGERGRIWVLAPTSRAGQPGARAE